MNPETDIDRQTAEPGDEVDQLRTAVRRLGSWVLGIVCGIVAGLAIFAATAILILKGGDVVGPNLRLLAQFFPGYTVTWPGAFLGFFYGFLTGFIAGWLIGWIYNTIVLFKSR